MSGEAPQDTTQTSYETTDRAADGSPAEKSGVAGNIFAPPPVRSFDKGERVYAYIQENGRTRRVTATVEDYDVIDRKWVYLLTGAEQRWYRERELAEADD